MTRHVVVRTIERADRDVVDAPWRARHRHRARGHRPPGLRRARTSARSSRACAWPGTAVTVSSHPGDNLMIHAAVEVCREGDVLVVTNTAPSTHGMFGELLATSLMARGVRALVIDAGVRDTAELRGHGLRRVVAARVAARARSRPAPAR